MSLQGQLKIAARDDGDVDPSFRDDVLKGLSECPKSIPARWFYDLRGSHLFEQITALPEYYPTRVETALLKANGADIGVLTGPGRILVEFGSGSSLKTRHVLRDVAPSAYVPIDISGDFLRQSSDELAAQFPGLHIVPVEADFMHPVALPDGFHDQRTLGFFPGSTIGNLTPPTAVDLLRSMRDTLGESAQLLIGFDRVKDPAVLIAAYDDAEGVTAEFNLNLLHRINRELEADIPVDRFRHAARWNPEWNRIEMHLEALRDLCFEISGRRFSLRKGESIHTENSHKYTPQQAQLLLHAGRWSPLQSWTDEQQAFLIILAEVTTYRSGP